MQHSDVIREALRKSMQLIEICTDWNLEEVEVDGEMIGVYELKDELRAAIDELDHMQQQDEGGTITKRELGWIETAMWLAWKEFESEPRSDVIADHLHLLDRWAKEIRTATPQPTMPDAFADFRNSQGAVDYAKQPGDVEVVVTVTPQQMEWMEAEARGTTLTVETLASTRLRKTMPQPTDEGAK